MAIRSFRHKGLKRLYSDDSSRGVPPGFAPKLRDMLAAIDAAAAIEDIGLFPGWRLHRLKGDLAGYLSLTVSGNWRLVFRLNNAWRFRDLRWSRQQAAVFRLEQGDAFDLDLVDYH